MDTTSVDSTGSLCMTLLYLLEPLKPPHTLGFYGFGPAAGSIAYRNSQRGPRRLCLDTWDYRSIRIPGRCGRGSNCIHVRHITVSMGVDRTISSTDFRGL